MLAAILKRHRNREQIIHAAGWAVDLQMSDVRDPEDRIETAVLEVEPTDARPEIMPPRAEPLNAGSSRGTSIVSRAIAPLRRISRRNSTAELPASLDVSMRQIDVALEPKSSGGAILITLILFVFLPTFVSGLYLFAFATDQYEAEARFAVRTVASDSGGKGDKEGPAANGTTIGGQEADIVANYIHSRAIIDEISRTVDVRAIFQRPESDFFARLPKNASSEDLTKYWNDMVSVFIEGTSGIVTVKTRAFRRDDALTLTKAIIHASEVLVSQMSADVRADAMKHAEDELRRSEADVRFALASLTAYRNSQGFLDPVKSAEQTGKLILQLMGDKIQVEGQLFVSERTIGPNAPGVTSLKARLESIDSHIAALQQQLAGDKNEKGNMAASIARFEELELKRQFSERLYLFARDGLDRARLIAESRSVYLAVFVPPSLPEDYSYPLRFTDFILILVTAIIFWTSGATIWASVLDHRL